MRNIAIFASGSGSNAENIINYFKGSDEAKVALVLCNNPAALVIRRAQRLGVPCVVFDREELMNGRVERLLGEYKIDFIVLAGFLWLMPKAIVAQYEGRMINIHPALLPKHGGKGMYGERVHQAVREAGDKKSGITIHYVNDKFDDGDVIFRAEVEIAPEDTPADIADKVHTLEYRYFPEIIKKCLR